MSGASDSPLGADSFQWGQVGDPIGYHFEGGEPRTTGATHRPSEAISRPLDGGRPSPLGVDRRTPEGREADILQHRARIDAARRAGLMRTEEALDNPSDLDGSWSR